LATSFSLTVLKGYPYSPSAFAGACSLVADSASAGATMYHF
jgi:hypothetical protein